MKELAWGAGAFILLFVLMRLVIFPKLRQGMDARYGKIRGDHDTAEATRAGAKAEVAEYEAALATVKAEARVRIDAARQTLEDERSAALDEANARIATRRAEATARTDAARAAAAPHIHEAVADVSSRAAELATGRRPDAATVTNIVASLMAGGGS
jgi:F-type H+-transporting ATPase subunit b